MFLRISDETFVQTDHVIAISKTDRKFELKFFCTHARIITLQFETEEAREEKLMFFKRHAG
jgi:hypothetical protein